MQATPRESERSGLDSDRLDSERLGRGLAVGFGVLCGLTFGLIVVGALVRANAAGLACPDWPLCFGQVVPRFDFRIALEWGHRVFAGGVSIGLLGLSIVVLRHSELRRRVVRPLALAWVLLAIQIVLGGLTVLLGLAPWTVTAHLLVGNSFAATLLWCARCVGRDPARERQRPAREPPLVRVLAIASGVAVLIQVGLGGVVASHYAGLACHSFPTCDGESFVPTLSGLVGLHVVHRLGGYAVALLFIVLAIVLRGSHTPIARLAQLGLRLIVLQVAVGVANVLLLMPVEVTALHSALAAALILVSAAMAQEVWNGRFASVVVGASRPERPTVARPGEAAPTTQTAQTARMAGTR